VEAWSRAKKGAARVVTAINYKMRKQPRKLDLGVLQRMRKLRDWLLSLASRPLSASRGPTRPHSEQQVGRTQVRTGLRFTAENMDRGVSGVVLA